MNEQLLHLDISKRPDASQTVRIGQGDVHGTTIVAEIFDNDVALDLSGKTARFLMRQPGGHDYVRETNCTVSGNRITYVVDESHVGTAAGYTDTAYFEILSGSTTIASTQRFRIEVLRHAMDGATPAQSWDTEIDELIQRGEQAVSDAEQAVDDATSAIDAANQAIARIEPTIEQAAENAAEQATADAEQRIQDAIDAMGDISELAVPLMSADVRGGAKLEESGGLALRDGALGIGSLVQQSDGYARGGIAEVTATGHAEQLSTMGKNLLQLPSGKTANGVTFTVNADGSVTASGTATANADFASGVLPLGAGTYTLTGCPDGGGSNAYKAQIIYGDQNLNLVQIFDSSSSGVATLMDGEQYKWRFRVYSGVTINATFYPQLELGSTATEYEPYTGGAPSPSPEFPQTIEVVRGRNLLDESKSTPNAKINTDGTIGWASKMVSDFIEIEPGTEYYVSNGIGGTGGTTGAFYDSAKQFIALIPKPSGYSINVSFETPANAAYVRLEYYPSSHQRYVGPPQLTLGSTPQPYVPYGHVGMEARDPDTDELISCTALPLPQRGWVAGLPDGTADSLRLDGAGKVKWELPLIMQDTFYVVDVVLQQDGTVSFRVPVTPYSASALCNVAFIGGPVDGRMVVVAGTTIYMRFAQSTVGSVDSDIKAWLDAHCILLYAIATPTTEDCGYVEDWPTDLPEGATVTISELDSVGIKYFIDSSVTELAKQWYARANSEYADRITALEQAVAELATS